MRNPNCKCIKLIKVKIILLVLSAGRDDIFTPAVVSLVFPVKANMSSFSTKSNSGK